MRQIRLLSQQECHPWSPVTTPQRSRKVATDLGRTWLRSDPTNTDKPKFYALSMFPHPSGSLHMGHVRNYVITDVIARLKRMQGYRVLHPMGWDGICQLKTLHSTEAPAKWTYQNIAQMRQQRLGLSIDWSQSPPVHQIIISGRRIFLQFLKAGLACKRSSGQLGSH